VEPKKKKKKPIIGTHLTTFFLVHQKSQANNHKKKKSFCKLCRKSDLHQIETAHSIYFSHTQNKCTKWHLPN